MQANKYKEEKTYNLSTAQIVIEIAKHLPQVQHVWLGVKLQRP
jgi:hypothetical protein